MSWPTNVIGFIVLLVTANPAKAFFCLPFFSCDTRNTENLTNVDVNQTSTTAPQMVTSPGSICKCLLHNQSRAERDALVIEIMKYDFIDLTQSVSNVTQGFVNFDSNVFDLEAFVLYQANVNTLDRSLDFALNGKLFFVDWIEQTRDFYQSYATLALYINQWYVSPLASQLQEIATFHGTSVGVFRARQTLTYDGICYTSQNQTGPYLFQHQCKINLSYLVRVPFGVTCNSTEKEKSLMSTTIESTFDMYFSSKSEKFVRSATFNISQENSTTDIFLELFYNANGSIWDIQHHLQSMAQLSITCEDSRAVVTSSPVSLINCTWYDPAFTANCMPSNGNSVSVNNSTQASTSFMTQTNFTGTNLATAPTVTTVDSTLRNDTLPTSIPQGNSNAPNPPSGPGSSTSTNSSGNGNSTSSPNSVQPQTLTTILTTQSTITAAPDSSNNVQSSMPTSLTGGSTAPINASPPSIITSNNIPTETSVASNAPASGVNNDIAIATSSSSLQASGQNQNASLSPTSASSYTGKTTPFDEDPFFKAVVPVFTKKFNDEYLLRAVGTMTPITAHKDFYWITVPICIVAVIFAMLCLMCLQVDWLMVCGGKWKETENLIK